MITTMHESHQSSRCVRLFESLKSDMERMMRVGDVADRRTRISASTITKAAKRVRNGEDVYEVAEDMGVKAQSIKMRIYRENWKARDERNR